MKLPRTQYIDHLVDEVTRIHLRLDETNRGLKARPLLVSTQAALAKQNQSRVRLHVFQQFEKVVYVGCHDSHVMLHGKCPNFVIRMTVEANMRNRLRKNTDFCESLRQERRKVLVKQ